MASTDLTESQTSTNKALIWASAAFVAGLGAWILFDAAPGINWVLWTGMGALGLVAHQRSVGLPDRPPMVIGLIAVIIAGGAAITANPLMYFLICVSVMVCLALQVRVALRPYWRTISLPFVALSPIFAIKDAVLHSIYRSNEATNQLKSARAQGAVRGLAITIPVLVIFTLLLSGADPVFASFTEALETIIQDWEFVPRIVFFVFLLVLVLGAYGLVGRTQRPDVVESASQPKRWLGSTERLILLTGMTALLWIFIALQVSYLFGNLPQVAGSGITFAEYARRGFAELSVVATISAILVLLTERFGQTDEQERVLRSLNIAVVVAVLCLLGSAFRRVWLYEQAYGYTTSRLYAQVYMITVAVGLLLLAIEIFGRIDTNRLFRRFALSAIVLFIGLVYWNHEGWIAERNIARFNSTGRIDVAYLANLLSPSALPAIAEHLPGLPEPTRSEILDAVRVRYENPNTPVEENWYEWNLARSRARSVLIDAFGVEPGNSLGSF